MHNALLQSAAEVVAELLERRGFALAGPVVARFETAAHGSTGVDVTVRLQDPSELTAATATISDHFGGDAGVDVIHIS